MVWALQRRKPSFALNSTLSFFRGRSGYFPAPACLTSAGVRVDLLRVAISFRKIRLAYYEKPGRVPRPPAMSYTVPRCVRYCPTFSGQGFGVYASMSYTLCLYVLRWRA